MKLYIVIPAYNESANIQKVIDDWYPVVERCGSDSRLVIANDGSRDDTFAIMEEMAKSRPMFIPIDKKNSGHGATVMYLYDYAIRNGADYVFQTDSDGQTLSSDFDKFYEDRDRFDIQIGTRYTRQDGLSRVFVTKVLKLVVLLIFGVVVKDANTPFRLMRTSVLKSILNHVPSDFNLCNVAISAIAVKKKMNVGWKPVTFKPRQGGINSINLKRIFKIGVKSVKDFHNINKALNDK